MHESLEAATRQDAHTAEIIAYAQKPHMDKAVRFRELADKISFRSIRENQYEKADWHEIRADSEARQAYKFMQEGRVEELNKLSDPDREPYIPKSSELQ